MPTGYITLFPPSPDGRDHCNKIMDISNEGKS